jgi:HEAT repeat protein
MKKSELQQIIKEEIQNTLKAYGSQEISKLTPGSEEDIYLDDTSGELSGEVVKKSEYLERMLEKAIKKKDWNIVMSAISYLKSKF